MKVYGVVYLIWNMLNGKKYVGQTTKIVEKRFTEHTKCKKSLIGKAIRKHGVGNFRYGVIKSCTSKAEMNYWEKFFIVALKSKKPYGYNLTDGGEGIVGYAPTRAHCLKLSASRRGEKNPNYGNHHTNESKAKISKKQKGIPKPLTACAKMSAARRSDSKFKNLLNELNERHLSYSALAQLLKVSHSTISLRMRGKYEFTEKIKSGLIEIFGKPIEYLLQHDEN